MNEFSTIGLHVSSDVVPPGNLIESVAWQSVDSFDYNSVFHTCLLSQVFFGDKDDDPCAFSFALASVCES